MLTIYRRANSYLAIGMRLFEIIMLILSHFDIKFISKQSEYVHLGGSIGSVKITRGMSKTDYYDMNLDLKSSAS